MGKEYIREGFQAGVSATGQNIIFYNDFSDVTKMDETNAGVNTTVAVETALCLVGTKRLTVHTTDTTPADNDSNGAECQFFPPVGKNIAVYTVARPSTAAKTLRFVIQVNSPTTTINFGVQYLVASNKWQYLNSAGSYVDIAGATRKLQQYSFFSLKMSIVPSTGYYKTLEINSMQYDLSAIAAHSAADTLGDGANFTFTIIADGTAQGKAQLDRLVISEVIGA